MAKTVAYKSKDIEHLNIGAEHIVEDVREEVRVLEVEQQREVDADAQDEPELRPLGAWYLLNYEKVTNSDKRQNEQEDTRSLVVEEPRGRHEVDVPCMQPSTTAAGTLHDKCKACINDSEERPEIELGEQQRMRGVVCEPFNHSFIVVLSDASTGGGVMNIS